MAKETKNPGCFRPYEVWSFDEPIVFALWDYSPSMRRLLLRHHSQGEPNIDLVCVSVQALQFDDTGVKVSRVENTYDDEHAKLVLFEDGQEKATIICRLWCLYQNDLWVLDSSLRTDRDPPGELVPIEDLVAKQAAQSMDR